MKLGRLVYAQPSYKVFVLLFYNEPIYVFYGRTTDIPFYPFLYDDILQFATHVRCCISTKQLLLH